MDATRIAALAVVLLNNVALADECDAVLARDYVRTKSDAKSVLTLLSLVESSNFDKFKQGFGASVSVPIDGVPVDFGGSHDSFTQQLATQKKVFNYTNDQQYSQSLASSTVPSTARTDWLECKKLKATKPAALTLGVEPVVGNGQEIIVNAIWTSGVGLGNAVAIMEKPPTISNGKLIGKLLRFDNAIKRFTVHRNDATLPLVVYMNLKNGSANIVFVDPVPADCEGKCSTSVCRWNAARTTGVCPASMPRLYLSSMSPATPPYNVHAGMSVDRSCNGGNISIAGTEYQRGIGMHAPLHSSGYVDFRVPRGYQRFRAVGGITFQSGLDDNCLARNSEPRVEMSVTVDGVADAAYPQRVLKWGEPYAIDINVQNANLLRLKVEAKNPDGSNWCAQSAWGDAYFE